MLGVAVLIIVMSVMNGFRTDLTNKIIGLNPHLILQFQNNKRLQDLKTVLKDKYPGVKITRSVSGEGIIIINNKVKGVLIKGIDKKDKKQSFINKEITKGSLKDFSEGKVMIGGELAFNLNLNNW